MRNFNLNSAMNPDCSPRSSISDNLLQIDQLEECYSTLKELGSGTYGKVLLCRCKQTDTKVALKVLTKSGTKLKDFLREFNYSYYLSPHRAILNTFDVAFETPTSYVFAQEFAPLGDLFDAITPEVGLPESQCKVVVKQIASALEFMHSKSLVHRDIKPENILVFDEHLSRVKLMDFGMTKRTGTMVRKVSTGIPYTPPEICEALKGERYSVEASADVWAFAVLIFCTLTGNFPWELAHHKDKHFQGYTLWQKRKTTKAPIMWKKFTPRLMRLYRRMLEPNADKRCSIKETSKYFEDDWLVPVKKSPHSPDHELVDDNAVASKENLNNMLEQHGIETKLSKKLRERRISEWVLST